VSQTGGQCAQLALVPLASLLAEPDVLSQRFGVQFHAISDDFGPLVQASLHVGSLLFILQRYREAAVCGTELFCTAEVDAEPDPPECLRTFMAGLGVRAAEIRTWFDGDAWRLAAADPP
jgi:hypothetical protein